MRFATRTFLWSFLPLVALLGASFWAVRTASISAAREGLRESLQKDQALLAGEHVRSARENGRLLRVVAGNAALKGGVCSCFAANRVKRLGTLWRTNSANLVQNWVLIFS